MVNGWLAHIPSLPAIFSPPIMPFSGGFMKNILQDLTYGCRALLKKPGFTIVAALSLALGIGANTVIFSLINTTLLRPLPFADPDKLMVVWSVPLQNRSQQNALNVSSFQTIRDKSRSLESIG